MKLFVYGSLLSGEAHHGRLAGSKRSASCRTVAKYTLVDLGPYPALLRGGTTCVFGEVYEIGLATLEALDAFEEHPVLYERIQIRLSDGQSAAGYALRQTALALGRLVISSGNWKNRVSERARALVTGKD